MNPKRKDADHLNVLHVAFIIGPFPCYPQGYRHFSADDCLSVAPERCRLAVGVCFRERLQREGGLQPRRMQRSQSPGALASYQEEHTPIPSKKQTSSPSVNRFPPAERRANHVSPCATRPPDMPDSGVVMKRVASGGLKTIWRSCRCAGRGRRGRGAFLVDSFGRKGL